MAKRCESCQVAMINGLRCHEIGCPEAWRDEVRECRWCGTEFLPEEKYQAVCCQGCAKSYWGD